MFDERVAHAADSAPPTSVVGQCTQCEAPWDDYSARHRCARCRVLILLCPRCALPDGVHSEHDACGRGNAGGPVSAASNALQERARAQSSIASASDGRGTPSREACARARLPPASTTRASAACEAPGVLCATCRDRAAGCTAAGRQRRRQRTRRPAAHSCTRVERHCDRAGHHPVAAISCAADRRSTAPAHAVKLEADTDASQLSASAAA